MDNLKTSARTDGCVSVKTGPLSVALKARMPMGCDVFEIVKLVEAEMHGKPLNAKTVYTFTEEVRKRIADLIVVEVDEIGSSIDTTTDGRSGSSAGKLYEVIFELNNGKRFFGYSDKDEPTVNGKFYHCSATKELKGRIVVIAENVSHIFFAPI